ncbi:aspartyl aminopeptidase [Oleiphilus messinensis]|uniref:M18 family aminopeptidase n=1 Tax=Oleiphilus messinensis TaxID=141451 RepID=A0A1Y0IAD9_9GAMM|nr:M18 family aminopeptidase [Oleiphilus messinensis]ARU57492.1 aspartyl aminopeptidase [Oleiphilus messinensis]
MSGLKTESFISELKTFLSSSPTPYHAVENVAEILSSQGFKQLSENEAWSLEAGGRYFVIRNGSTIAAFITPQDKSSGAAIRMAGAHTDSPCLKVKPHAEIKRHGYFQVGVDLYGGVLLNPWYDRDLSLAGRVVYRDKQRKLHKVLIDFKRAIATIPSLAIHLDREANSKRSINPQTDLPPVLMRVGEGEEVSFRSLLSAQIEKQYPDLKVDQVLDYELSFYDTQAAEVIGLQSEFLASARLDNLLSCYICLQALITSDGSQPALIVFNDHEEVGSLSAEGAQGPFLRSVLERIYGQGEVLTSVLSKSLMISADNAHGIHPNFPGKHDEKHGPLMGEGPVIKVNVNQRYATSSETSSYFKHLCDLNQLPCQYFTVRSDMACGSTIGPLTAGEIGVRTIDVGVPQFAMHSIRELASVSDVVSLYRVLKAYFVDALQLPE